MKAIITKASDWNFEEEKDIYSLEDLIHLLNEYKSEIIMSESEGELYIKIYDYYVE